MVYCQKILHFMWQIRAVSGNPEPTIYKISKPLTSNQMQQQCNTILLLLALAIRNYSCLTTLKTVYFYFKIFAKYTYRRKTCFTQNKHL